MGEATRVVDALATHDGGIGAACSKTNVEMWNCANKHYDSNNNNNNNNTIFTAFTTKLDVYQSKGCQAKVGVVESNDYCDTYE